MRCSSLTGLALMIPVPRTMATKMCAEKLFDSFSVKLVSMSKSFVISVVGVVSVLIGLGFLAFGMPGPTAPSTTPSPDDEVVSLPTASALPSPVDTVQPSPSAAPSTVTIQAQDIDKADAAFQFTSVMQARWEAEAIAATQAISLYDPAAPGESNLEKSQIFIRSFSADDFLTLSTVNILNQKDLTLDGRPAVEYEIENKAGVPNFVGQPSWRSERHIVTDVRVSDTNPSVFYVIAKRPDLDDATYQAFLDTLQVISPGEVALVEPVADFSNRITKKPFGVYITPQNSPVQPERFSGYHTAVDVEYEDVAGEVPVVAMADGKVVVSRTANGYGGVLLIQHEIDGEAVQSLYGHLDPASLAAVGSTVEAGEQIGILGDGGTAETDGERKHLHFGILKGATSDIRGYVSGENELATWYDPVSFLSL